MRRTDDDRRALVVRTDLGGRDEADRIGDARAKRPVADDRRVGCPPSPRRSRESPSLPTGGRRRGHAVGRPTPRRQRESPLRDGTTRTSRAPSSRAACASASDGQSTTRARRTSIRAAQRTRRASSTSVPQSWRTKGFRAFTAGSADGSQWAWTTSASRAARRAACEYDARNSGTRSTFHGRRLRFPTMPCPYASPKWRNERGRDDLDGDSCRPQVLDRIAYERPRDVVRPARVRRRENDDLHSRRARATTGSAAASVANT